MHLSRGCGDPTLCSPHKSLWQPRRWRDSFQRASLTGGKGTYPRSHSDGKAGVLTGAWSLRPGLSSRHDPGWGLNYSPRGLSSEFLHPSSADLWGWVTSPDLATRPLQGRITPK